jgi:hypothetical protein
MDDHYRNVTPGATVSSRLAEIRARLDWWRPGPDKVLSVKATAQLIDDVAALLAMYDTAGLASDRAQVIRAALERWEDNPPQVAGPVILDDVFSLVADGHWLMGAVEAAGNA